MRALVGTVLVAVVASFALAGAGTAGRASVVLVPIGSSGKPSLSALAAHFRQKLRVNVRVLAPVPVPADAYDSSRRQDIGGKLLAQVERAYPSGVVIGITTRDIYMAQKAYRFVFAIRDVRAAVVSTARMDPTFYGLPADNELSTSRIQKMTTKVIGVLALGRRESSNPRSVLYTPILGLNDLDFMTEDFAPRPYSAAKRTWLIHTRTACSAANAQEAALRATPVRTTDDLLAVLNKGLEIEKHLFATLKSLKTPPGDSALIAKLRSTFATGLSLDQAALTSLTAKWDANRFKQWATQTGAIDASLEATSLRLGSRLCATYFGS